MEVAIADIRSQSFYGFAILLQMLKGKLHLSQDLTFLMPVDQELSKYSISPDDLEDFLLSHSIPKPLTFSDLTHFPTGTMVPTGLHNQLIKIENHGRANFSVNNAQLVTPNVCLNTIIKCHGIDAVIKYNNYSNYKKLDEHSTEKTPKVSRPTAPVSRNLFSGHH